MPPLIGITADVVSLKRDPNPRTVIDSGVYDGVLAAGGLPIIIPPIAKEEVIEPILDRLDGIVMTGGGDLNPLKLGKKAHPTIKPMHPRREEFDRLLCRFVIERKTPLLCIGVSMQLVNVMFGGQIYSHLPEDMPRGIPHFDPHDSSHRHIVFVTPRTRLEEIYGEGEIRVNSSHHQGIKTLGRGLRSGALAPDGLIESIESIDPNWFMLGVQWHPESHSASALDRQLFEGFIESCAEADAVPAGKPRLVA